MTEVRSDRFAELDRHVMRVAVVDELSRYCSHRSGITENTFRLCVVRVLDQPGRDRVSV